MDKALRAGGFGHTHKALEAVGAVWAEGFGHTRKALGAVWAAKAVAALGWKNPNQRQKAVSNGGSGVDVHTHTKRWGRWGRCGG